MMTITDGLWAVAARGRDLFGGRAGAIRARTGSAIWPTHKALGAAMLALLCVHLELSSGDTSALSTDLVDGDSPTYEKQVSSQCQYPCKCAKYTPQCKAGVGTKKDGCDCCFICTRQQGDLCDAKDICDEDKGLYCDFKLDGGLMGICRAKAAKPCNVDGTSRKDGEEFKLNCSLLCLCQNGQYSCSTLCPQEDRAPSAIHCKEPLLVKIGDNCCKEWVCPYSNSLPGPDDFPPAVVKPIPTQCRKETTEWSACSQTCGMGVSIRVTNENRNCETMQERRLCFVRPCDLRDRHLEGKACKSTWKESESRKLLYGECESVLLYRPKYCSTCKKNKCCGPGRTKTRRIEFKCPDGKVFTEQFMWVKNCECFKTRRCPFR